MLFQEPKVVFVQLKLADAISTSQAAGYTICQFQGGNNTNVTCADIPSIPDLDVSQLCETSCDKSASTDDYDVYNNADF